jgi:predicted nucleic acid-binding protein
MDACALIAFLQDEPGAETVTAILRSANDGDAVILINKINHLEVYYDIYRRVGKEKADDELAMIKKLPVIIQSELCDEVFLEAGRLKAAYKISLADAIALAEALISNRELLTADHHEFDDIERCESIHFHWIR